MHSNTPLFDSCFSTPTEVVSSPWHWLLPVLTMMQEKKNKNSHSLGICQRLFNFFNNLVAPTLSKRITLGHPLPPGSTQWPLDDSVRKGVGSVGEHQPISSAKHAGVMNVQYWAHGYPTDILGSEIQVHFKQSDEELESWTPVGKDDAIVHAEQPQLQKKEKMSAIPLKEQASRDKVFSKKEIPLFQGDDISRGATSKSRVLERTESSQLQGKSTQATESNFTNKAPSRGPNLMVSLRNSADEQDKNRKKGTKIPSENLTSTTQDEHSKANTTPSRFRPLLMATPHNINEKSDIYIKRRKEAMSDI